MPTSTRGTPLLLKGYIEQVGPEDFFAICLTLNVCTRGTSLADAEQSLVEAVELYLADAVKDGALSQWVPRRAPLYHHMRYWIIWLRTRLRICLPTYDAQLIARVVHA